MHIGSVGILGLLTAGARVWARWSGLALSQDRPLNFKVHPIDSATKLLSEKRL